MNSRRLKTRIAAILATLLLTFALPALSSPPLTPDKNLWFAGVDMQWGFPQYGSDRYSLVRFSKFAPVHLTSSDDRYAGEIYRWLQEKLATGIPLGEVSTTSTQAFLRVKFQLKSGQEIELFADSEWLYDLTNKRKVRVSDDFQRHFFPWQEDGSIPINVNQSQ